MTTVENQCSKSVSESEGLATYRHQCTRKAAVQRDGKGYCKQHDPVARAAREKAAREESDAKWDALRAKQDADYRRDKAIERLRGWYDLYNLTGVLRFDWDELEPIVRDIIGAPPQGAGT